MPRIDDVNGSVCDDQSCMLQVAPCHERTLRASATTSRVPCENHHAGPLRMPFATHVCHTVLGLVQARVRSEEVTVDNSDKTK